MEYIEVNCVTGNIYSGFVLSHQRNLPKSAKLYNCGQEYKNGILGRSFNVYKSMTKKSIKSYIIFAKEYKY